MPNQESKMVEGQLNSTMMTTLTLIGDEQIPILVIDNLVTSPELLIDLACTEEQDDGIYQKNNDYYPGTRKASPGNYINQLNQLLPLMKTAFKCYGAERTEIILSAFSISTTPVEQLRPIQMLPHFDTPADDQFAMVHYLCESKHGGTSWYRHKSTGFESITHARQSSYRVQLKQQAIAAKLHERPEYIDGSTQLFKRIHAVEAKMNRAVIYPSNALHSGNVKPNLGLSAAPKQGRLTISSFIRLI